MHEPEYEKKIQQKMQELKFSPSESVWANVEKKIKKDKKRKRPLLWFFLILGLAVSGGASYFIYTRKNTGEKNITYLYNQSQLSGLKEKKPGKKTDAKNIPKQQ